tara:strand:- start:215 stop:1717 length:1503 start_codon:yes stop_codon:yes gene_type:complete
MITPSQLFEETKEVIEVVEETIEDKQTLEEDISHSVSLIDGAFRNIQEQILNSNKKELSSYKNQVIEVYNICNDIKENQLPRYKKEVLQSDLRTDSKIAELKKELYETLEERIEETKETIQVFFREEVKELKNLRSSVVLVEKYIRENSSAIVNLREEVFAQLRESNNDTEVNQIVIQDKLDEISKEYETLSEGLLNEPPSTKTEDPLTPTDQNFVTLDQLQAHYKLFVNRVTQQLSTLGGGGEVRLEFLDDIDRSTALIDGRVLAYQSSTGKFIGTTTSSGSGLPSGSVGQLLQHNGSSFVGIASTGFRDYVIDHGQGYYAYTTDYYTVGVANTTQEIEEGVWTLVQPKVASDGLYNHQPSGMNGANSGNPWIGAGATIGTGQTEFSLAGTKPGTSCIVRSVFRFEPDTDETDLDMRLHFTTNTATQGTGLTNFNIEKQALVMTVGAATTYTSETLISFFVGDTLYGDTKTDAGSFCVEVNGTTDGTLEILGLTVMVDI